MGFPKRNEDGASKSVERKIGDLYLYLMRLFLPQHHKTKHPFKLVAWISILSPCLYYSTLQQEAGRQHCLKTWAKIWDLFSHGKQTCRAFNKTFPHCTKHHFSVCKSCGALKLPLDSAFAALFPNLCDVCLRTAGRSERQRRGSFSHQRGQEPGVGPADGLVSVAAHHLSSAQHLQPHGDIFRVVPPQGQPLHPLPRFLPLRRGGGLRREERQENH